MARIGRWTSNAPAVSLAANVRTLITMPAASLVTTTDDFTPVGMSRFDGTRFRAYGTPEHPESLDIVWALDVTMPLARRPLVTTALIAAGQKLGEALGGVLNLNVSLFGDRIVGATVADGSQATYLTIDDYVGVPTGEPITDGTMTIRGGELTVKMQTEGPIKPARVSIERSNLNPGALWLANGMRLYLTSPVACTVALRIVNVRQVR